MSDESELEKRMGRLERTLAANDLSSPGQVELRRIFGDIAAERERQRKQWGDANDDGHTAHMWGGLYAKWLGRLASDLLDSLAARCPLDEALRSRREILVRLASIIVAEIGAIDRKLSRDA